MTDLDNILSGQGEAAPETNAENDATQTATTEGQPAGGDAQPVNGSEQEGDQGQKMVPHEALHAEKQKTKRYTEEVTSLRKEIADRDAAWERRIAQLMEAQKPRQEPQQKPDWFENPDAALQHTLQQSVSPQFDHITQTLMANAQIVAGLKYGDDKVKEAEQAFISAMQSGALDPADYQRVVSSPNRYAAAAEWHRQQQAKAEIGDDINAFRERVRAEERQKALEELQQGNGQSAQQRQPVMPSNLAGARNVGARGGPAWSGPPSLQDIFNRTPASG